MPTRKPKALIAALRAVQEDARRSSLDKLSNREINAEITANRRERQKTSKQATRRPKP